MILLGVDEEGQIVFTDSATRDWAGEQQRLKRAKLPELISYMFPQKNVGDTHLYFSRKKEYGRLYFDSLNEKVRMSEYS